MSSGHHDDHSMEQKPVSFTVPFFLAAAFLIIVVLFLSLCDPKPHHAGTEGHGHEGAATEAMHHDAAATEHHEGAAAAEHHDESQAVKSDSMPVETTAPEAEPAHH